MGLLLSREAEPQPPDAQAEGKGADEYQVSEQPAGKKMVPGILPFTYYEAEESLADKLYDSCLIKGWLSRIDKITKKRHERWCAIDENHIFEFEPEFDQMILKAKLNLEGAFCWVPTDSKDTFILHTAGLFHMLDRRSEENEISYTVDFPETLHQWVKAVAISSVLKLMGDLKRVPNLIAEQAEIREMELEMKRERELRRAARREARKSQALSSSAPSVASGATGATGISAKALARAGARNRNKYKISNLPIPVRPLVVAEPEEPGILEEDETTILEQVHLEVDAASSDTHSKSEETSKASAAATKSRASASEDHASETSSDTGSTRVMTVPLTRKSVAKQQRRETELDSTTAKVQHFLSSSAVSPEEVEAAFMEAETTERQSAQPSGGQEREATRSGAQLSEVAHEAAAPAQSQEKGAAVPRPEKAGRRDQALTPAQPKAAATEAEVQQAGKIDSGGLGNKQSIAEGQGSARQGSEGQAPQGDQAPAGQPRVVSAAQPQGVEAAPYVDSEDEESAVEDRESQVRGGELSSVEGQGVHELEVEQTGGSSGPEAAASSGPHRRGAETTAAETVAQAQGVEAAPYADSDSEGSSASRPSSHQAEQDNETEPASSHQASIAPAPQKIEVEAVPYADDGSQSSDADRNEAEESEAGEAETEGDGAEEAESPGVRASVLAFLGFKG